MIKRGLRSIGAIKRHAITRDSRVLSIVYVRLLRILSFDVPVVSFTDLTDVADVDCIKDAASRANASKECAAPTNKGLCVFVDGLGANLHCRSLLLVPFLPPSCGNKSEQVWKCVPGYSDSFPFTRVHL